MEQPSDADNKQSGWAHHRVCPLHPGRCTWLRRWWALAPCGRQPWGDGWTTLWPLEMNSLQWGEAELSVSALELSSMEIRRKKKKKEEAMGWQSLNLYHQREGEMKSQAKWLHYSHNTVASVIKCCEQGRQQTEGDFGEEVFELGLKSWITGAFQTKEKPESIKAQRCQKCRFAGNRKGKPWEETGQERWVAAVLAFLGRGELHSCM